MNPVVLVMAALAVRQAPSPSAPRLIISAPLQTALGAPAGGGSAVTPLTNGTWYVYSGATLCDTSSAQTTRPTSAGYGWELKISPLRGSDAAPGPIDVRWRQLTGHGTSMGPARSRSVMLGPGDSIALDTIQATSATTPAEQQAWLQHLLTKRDEELLAVPEIGTLDPVRRQLGALDMLLRQRQILLDREKLLSVHPRVVALDTDIQSVRHLAAEEARQIVQLALRHPESDVLPAPAGGLCPARSMTLTIGLENAPASSPIVETELWLVHTRGDGTDVSQRQSTRSRGESAHVYFDPLVAETPSGQQRISVDVTLASVRVQRGTVYLELKISRQGPGGPIGSATYPISILPGEVVAIASNPLSNTDRIALRLRVRLIS